MAVICTLVGRVGGEVRTSNANGTPVVNFRVGARVFVGKGKGYQGSDYDSQWYGVSYFGARATSLAPLLTSGKEVQVSGELVQETYRSKSGEDRDGLNIKAATVDLVGPKGDAPNGGPGVRSAQPQARIDAEDIPF